jgi:N-acetylmuramic acid 6-phosphate etherase
MTRLGHVHDGLMVSMQPDCSKLEERATRIVAAIAGCTLEEASMALEASAWVIKPAVLIARGVEAAAARDLLVEAGGNLRATLRRLTVRLDADG